MYSQEKILRSDRGTETTTFLNIPFAIKRPSGCAAWRILSDVLVV